MLASLPFVMPRRPRWRHIYVRLVLAMTGATLVFGEVPDLVSTTGVFCIVIACVVVDRAAVAAILGWVETYRRFRLDKSRRRELG